eukprot:TRINITY_DN5863_c0_g1_i1.p1 TRINITY_DN5863_c0_g1~~TRINITY_DN5863_c0_g1_i1.p1  ORF type:complete len:140 (-),score=32.44 TRINITY_DN5863_c0_g1_i1:186-605(-)
MSLTVPFSPRDSFSLETSSSPSRFSFFSSFSPTPHKRRSTNLGSDKRRSSRSTSPSLRAPLPISIHRIQAESHSPYSEAGLEVQSIFLRSVDRGEQNFWSRELDRPAARASHIVSQDFDALVDMSEWHQLETRSVTPFV